MKSFFAVTVALLAGFAAATPPPHHDQQPCVQGDARPCCQTPQGCNIPPPPPPPGHGNGTENPWWRPEDGKGHHGKGHGFERRRRSRGAN